MVADFFDFTPETLGYKGKLNKNNMIDVPLSFGGISYRCTCVNYEGMNYVVMPFRRVTEGLAKTMGEKVDRSGYFCQQVYTIIAQIVDRHNMIIEYCPVDLDNQLDMDKLAKATVGALWKMGYIEKEVSVKYKENYSYVDL